MTFEEKIDKFISKKCFHLMFQVNQKTFEIDYLGA